MSFAFLLVTSKENPLNTIERLKGNSTKGYKTLSPNGKQTQTTESKPYQEL